MPLSKLLLLGIVPFDRQLARRRRFSPFAAQRNGLLSRLIPFASYFEGELQRRRDKEITLHEN